MTRHRGGYPQSERDHASILLSHGAGRTWGWESPAGRARVERRALWIAGALGLRPGLRVLECGCGTGIFTRALARFGAEITAVDIAPELLAEAARLTDAPNVRFVEGNLEAPGILPEASFDAIYGVSVLHHLDLDAALPALRALLVPGAAFAFSEPNIANPLNKFYYYVDSPEKRRQRGQSPTEMAFSRDELAGLLARHSFVPTEVVHRDFMHPGVPGPLVPVLALAERLAEALPLVRRISGSLWALGHVQA